MTEPVSDGAGYASSDLRAEPGGERSANIARRPEILVCFSHLRWGFVFQRPQHLMTRAADKFRVIYWEEPMYEAGIEPFLARFPQSESLEVITPKLPEGMDRSEENAVLCRLLREHLQNNYPGQPIIAWYYTPMMLACTEGLSLVRTVYDKMDELAAFKDAPADLQTKEKQLFEKADVVFTGGMSIYEANRNAHANIHPFPSSIDRAHFAEARARHIEEPADQSSIARPRIGWFGVIDERMDLDLLANLANAKPDWQFVMVGPVVKIDPGSLPRTQNIHWLGAKSYDELPLYLAGWDAGIIPFAINDSTRFISPTKTPEYLAAGVPVASTPIRDIVRPYGEAGVVEIAASAGEMEAALSRAMEVSKLEWIEKVDHLLRDKSWDQTWHEMEVLLLRGRRDTQGEAA